MCTVQLKNFISGLALVVLFSHHANSQVAHPPAGDNQRSMVCQWIGEVEICVTYNSPDVTLPSGKSRRGEIWGRLVPYGLYAQPWLEDEGETPEPKPWRAGANENTMISFSHDVLVEGERVPAGSYGLFFIAGAHTWELILSHDFDKWGAYFYDEKNDLIRAEVTPQQATFSEWLAYEFVEKKPTSTSLALRWEDLEVPIQISVENIRAVYLEEIKKDLTSDKMQYWYNWHEGARYCLENNIEPELGLKWADKAINQGWVGDANFQTLKTKSELLRVLDRVAEADSLMQAAIDYFGGVIDLHNYGRELLAQDRSEEALKVFERNAAKHPDYWVTKFGLARGLAATGDHENALKYAKEAQAIMPKEELRMRKAAVYLFIEQVEKGEQPIIYLAKNWVQIY